ncbi:MAG: TetR/AcrR family transcriptional regulator [Acidobacteriota bacterium]|nr:TetR/AcrR family transcriptional regulator [Acidobacteriota bacterium]
MTQRKSDSAKVIEFSAAGKDLLSRRKLIKRVPVTELGHKIVAATVEEFAVNGVQGTRVAEICRRAGTTDPTFYRYFLGLRQAALFIISEYYWSPLNQRLNHYRQITDDPQKLFEAVVTSLICSADDDPDRPWLAESKVFQIVVAESRNPLLVKDLALDDEYVGFLARLEEIIKTGQRLKFFTPDLRPALLASLLVNSLHGLLAQNRFRFQSFHVEESEVRRVAAKLVGVK